MTTPRELIGLDVATLAHRLRQREISPVDLTEAYLSRIEALNGKLNAYITVTADLAREQARVAERELAGGHWRGPFHGVPIGLKDLCYTRGIATTAASKLLKDFKPDHDCTVWRRLAEAGAILLGKLNLHEFAYGFWSTSEYFGAVRNPYDPARIAGGSSGGSAAAIVARMAAATIGTDTGGSIRVPAAMCGCVGLKPTWSRVSRYGVVPLAYTLDHVGPITATVRDAALMLRVIAGCDPDDPTSSNEPVPDYAQALQDGIKGMRIGVIRELREGLSPEVEASFSGALQQLSSLGAQVEELSVPQIVSAPLVVGIITWAEALEYHEDWMRDRKLEYGDDVRRLLETGFATTATSYIRAQRARARILADAMRALETHAVLVAPAAPMAAPEIDEVRRLLKAGGTRDLDFLRLTGPFDATGQPALAIPTGLSPAGLPLSMQIIGKPFDEGTVIRVAGAYEAARGPLPAPRL